jgi:threonyl-tRNA synthetase
MIHRAPFGSMERFVAVMIENCAGNFPLWLAPEQLAILPISEKYHNYAHAVAKELEQHDIRAIIDERDEKIGRKIRDAEVSKLPYMLIVGEKEAGSNTVSLRKHGEGDLGSFGLEQFIDYFKTLVAKSLNPS